ncbi:MAG: hypothetical protein JSV91_13055 [Phycisphaerales bacterium]|nr:MAG: hypothetical protein JSV91_13055 [Phycisphaerales bacterium]
MLPSFLLASLFAAVLLGGCQPASRSTGMRQNSDGGASADGDAVTWPFWPRSIRIHPLTRFTTDRETGGLLIEARLEFLDAEGHNTKGLGQVRFDLHSALPSEDARSLENWNKDLRDLAENLNHFDDVTRTYLFRLEIEESLLPRRPMLKAYFLSADGATMENRFKFPVNE